MPIANIQDTSGVEQKLQDILSNSDVDGRLKAIRELFVEILDYDNADQLVSLESSGNAQLPKDAHVTARRDGVTVAYIPLDDAQTNRVNGIVVSAAAKTLGNILSDDLLLLFTNRDMDQLHIISPDLSGSRPKLQRLVAYRDQMQRTVPQQIANMWDSYGNQDKTLREAIAEAFNVEPVTREFFGAYRKLFEAAEAQITGFTTAEEEQKHMFTQTLFNRLMFVYFLSRKGWLRFDGSADYLNALWQDYGSLDGDHDFYTARLKSLFFAGLNNPQSRNLVQDNPVLYRAIGDVPFLNGGLFEETDLDKRQDIKVPDETIGHILTDLFDQFNFTVMESTPYDVEVAVDPEMLGKVFEELVTERHASGAYYTPRPVVSFMCREAIKGYLEGKETGASPVAIARFVDRREPEGIALPEARRISQALDEVTVVDPACGSGAYLLGMMQELIELQSILYNAGVDDKKMYDLKLEIIQRNLYGVDIDDFAVNIAMLRLWLSLAIEYDSDNPPPLPNLDFKVLCGDSLLGPDPSAGVEVQGTLGQDIEQFRHLGQLKADHMRAYLDPEKDRLRATIREIEIGIREALGAGGADAGVIDWRVEFADVFAEQRGFDIAIANPPYIQLQGNGGMLANLYSNAGYQTFARTGDIYQLFYERGCQVLKASKGLLAYITSNSWLKAKYGKATRRFLAENHTPLSLLELGKDVFETAIVDSGVLLLSTGGKGQAFPGVDMDRLDCKEIPPEPVLWGQIRPDREMPWSIFSPLEQSVMGKMQAKGTPLKDWDVGIFRGITTGLNDAFILDNATKEALVAADSKSVEILRPALQGKDIQRYHTSWKGRWLIDTHNGYGKTPPVDIQKYFAVKTHLDKFYDRLETRQDKGRTPYNLRSCAYYEEFAKEKLLWIELVDKGRFAYDNSGMFCSNSAYLLSGASIKYLCAVLNSTTVTWFMKYTALTSGMGATRWIKSFIDTIPVPKVSPANQHPFIHLVDQILKAKDVHPDADTREMEREIDRLVYELYELTDEDITAVQGTLGAIPASS